MGKTILEIKVKEADMADVSVDIEFHRAEFAICYAALLCVFDAMANTVSKEFSDHGTTITKRDAAQMIMQDAMMSGMLEDVDPISETLPS